MKLVVCSTRDQQHNLARQYPKDKVVCVGDALHGIMVTEIVNESNPRPHHKTELTARWWEYALCRVGPQEIGTQ